MNYRRELRVRWRDGAFYAYAWVELGERLVGGLACRDPFETSAEAWAWLGSHVQ